MGMLLKNSADHDAVNFQRLQHVGLENGYRLVLNGFDERIYGRRRSRVRRAISKHRRVGSSTTPSRSLPASGTQPGYVARREAIRVQ